MSYRYVAIAPTGEQVRGAIDVTSRVAGGARAVGR